MKWFKHEADAFLSEGVDAIIDAEGFAGYGRWNRILEIVAFKMDETDRCHAEYSIQKWCRLLGLKQKKLISFLELTENQLKTKVVYSENIIRIEIPNLLKKRDNYSKNLQVTKKQLASKEVEVEVEVEVDKKKTKTFTLDSIEYQLSELLFTEILKRNPEHKQPNLQTWSKDIDKMIRLDNRQSDKIKKVILWSQQDAFWQANILSIKTLRKQYDKLLIKMNTSSNGSAASRHTGLNEKNCHEGVNPDGSF